MNAEERHAALRDATPSARALYYAVAALTRAGEPRSRERLMAVSGLPYRTMKRAKAELLDAGLLPGERERTPR